MTQGKTNPILPARALPRPAPGAQGAIEAQAAAEGAAQPVAAALTIRDLTVAFGARQALKQVSMDIPARAVTAVIGPGGCGKSTLLRALNRLHDLVPSARVEGQVRLFGADIYGPGVEPAVIRRRVGMVFQESNPFPTMSVADNVTVGLRLNGVRDRAVLAERLHQSLVMAILWDEVKDRLDAPAISLSGGQQQRLCIARALAVQPEVLLMDEPASALDPQATARIEELILELKENFTIVIVTHNMQQAARVSDYTAFFNMGQLVEYGATVKIFTNPARQQTEDYVTGRFG
jgi:phosphate transport system ATP-binding protein